MTVRIAVIGAGIMGADHARILAEEVPGARVQVVVDADGARARAVAEACGAEAGRTGSRRSGGGTWTRYWSRARTRRMRG